MAVWGRGGGGGEGQGRGIRKEPARLVRVMNTFVILIAVIVSRMCAYVRLIQMYILNPCSLFYVNNVAFKIIIIQLPSCSSGDF